MPSPTWIYCPLCQGKTRNQIRQDTILIRFPLFCPKCKQTTLINVKNLKIAILKEPVAQTPSQHL